MSCPTTKPKSTIRSVCKKVDPPNNHSQNYLPTPTPPVASRSPKVIDDEEDDLEQLRLEALKTMKKKQTTTSVTEHHHNCITTSSPVVNMEVVTGSGHHGSPRHHHHNSTNSSSPQRGNSSQGGGGQYHSGGSMHHSSRNMGSSGGGGSGPNNKSRRTNNVKSFNARHNVNSRPNLKVLTTASPPPSSQPEVRHNSVEREAYSSDSNSVGLNGVRSRRERRRDLPGRFSRIDRDDDDSEEDDDYDVEEESGEEDGVGDPVAVVDSKPLQSNRNDCLL